MALAAVAMTIAVAGLAALRGGTWLFNLGQEADRAADHIAKGGFLYSRWPSITTDALYWRLLGGLLLVMAFGLLSLIAAWMLGATHLA